MLLLVLKSFHSSSSFEVYGNWGVAQAATLSMYSAKYAAFLYFGVMVLSNKKIWYLDPKKGFDLIKD